MVWHDFLVNTLRPRQNGRHFPDDIFTCIFFNENCCILIKFSLKYIRKGPIDNNPALVQIMAWRRSGDKPLSEPMMVSLLTHICVTRPQWVKMLQNGLLPDEKPWRKPVSFIWLTCQFIYFRFFFSKLKIFIQGIVFENVGKIVTILFRV